MSLVVRIYSGRACIWMWLVGLYTIIVWDLHYVPPFDADLPPAAWHWRFPFVVTLLRSRPRDPRRRSGRHGTGGGPARPPAPRELRGLEEVFASHTADALREATGPDGPRGAPACGEVGLVRRRPSRCASPGGSSRRGGSAARRRAPHGAPEHLVEIFSTRDAYEGLSSLGKRAPVFEGR